MLEHQGRQKRSNKLSRPVAPPFYQRLEENAMAKKSAKGGGTIRQRSDGRWEARYTVGRDPGTGKQIQRSVYGATQKEVRQKLAQAVAALDNGTYQAPNKITVKEWMTEWLTTFCANKVKPLTYQSYEAIIKNHVTPVMGAVELQAVKGTHIQRLYNSMTAAGLSGKTVKNVGAIPAQGFQRGCETGNHTGQPLRRRRTAQSGAARNCPSYG